MTFQFNDIQHHLLSNLRASRTLKHKSFIISEDGLSPL